MTSRIFSPRATPDKVSTFVRLDGEPAQGHVTCFPLYGGFRMRIREKAFEDAFVEVTETRYMDLLQKYEPIDVCFDTAASRDEIVSGFTNGKLWNGWECPVFTREAVERSSSHDGRGALSPNSYSQIIWCDEPRGFIVIASHRGDLPEQFDVTPYLGRIAEAENQSFYDVDSEVEISLCQPFAIRVGSEVVEVYDVNVQGWCWQNAEGMEFEGDSNHTGLSSC